MRPSLGTKHHRVLLAALDMEVIVFISADFRESLVSVSPYTYIFIGIQNAQRVFLHNSIIETARSILCVCASF